jgi:hypothetical protein
MIATWVLIMWINGGNGNTAIYSIPFTSEITCRNASIDVKIKNAEHNVQQEGGHFPIFTVCVQR